MPHTLTADTAGTVRVRAPGRLHLGFLDPSGALGRRFGSIGLVIEGFETTVEIAAARGDRLVADTPEAEAQLARAAGHLRTLRERTRRDAPLQLRLVDAPPAHAGFGSGTQLALAIGRAYARWHRLDLATPTLAHWLGRGLRSGIGLHGFDQGGLLVDGGPDAEGRPAPLLSRIVLPPAWRVVVAQDRSSSGLAGEPEKAAIAALEPMPASRAAAICHEVLMRVLPGAASDDFGAFALGLTHLQQWLGEHYAPAQGGSPYTSRAVGRLLRWARSAGGEAAVGQSSWGPTGFAVVASEARARALVAEARAAGAVEPQVELGIVAARQRGAEIIDTRAAAPEP